MTMKPLPDAVQSLIYASTRTNTYKKAIEELVYNALDAKATSIAIRLDIPENTIQVIDNGCGIAKTDIKHVGKKHMTSKTVDLSSLKSVPNCYGFRGQSLASLIEVSRVVKITSRVDGTDETWVKTFSKGREKSMSTTSTRPSKGTTIEIQGFLYNLTIQKKSVNTLTEQQDIKNFLQQLSLIHNNVSISFRDNSKNDIVFQIHKCRDIYQTLSTLFTIQKGQIQELQVEKRHYKVTAYIGKDLSDKNDYHWVYLNGRFVPRCRLHKILDSNIAKLLGLTNHSRKKIKVGHGFAEDEKGFFKKNIPFYFVFITCPYSDYDMNELSNKLNLEFKDWNNVTKILEKLVKFYTGDLDLTEVNKMTKIDLMKEAPVDTRDEVKKIMEKILASNSRKLGVSQMQNGIKGKLIKRKKKNKIKDISLSKVLPNYHDKARKVDSPREIMPTPDSPVIINESDQNECKLQTKGTPNNKNGNIKRKTKIIPEPKETIKIKKQIKQSKLKTNETVKQIMIKNSNNITETLKNQRLKVMEVPKKTKVNILVKSFQDKPSVVKQRCKLLTKKVDRLRQIKNMKNKRKITFSESSEYSNILRKKNQRITMKKTVGEIIIQESIPLPPKHPHKLHGNVYNDNPKKQYTSSYDLLQTILKSQDKLHSYYEAVNRQNCRIMDTIPSPTYVNPQRKSPNFKQQNLDASILNKYSASPTPIITVSEPKSTYESHAYYRKQRDENITLEYETRGHSNRRFITKQSKDNFTLPRNNFGQRIWFKPYKRNYAKDLRKLSAFKNLGEYRQHSYTIEFTQTNQASKNTSMPSEIILNENMYTINREDEHMNTMTNILLNGTYTISKMAIESQQIEQRFFDPKAPQQHEEIFKDMNTIEDSPLNSFTSINTIEDSLAKSYKNYCIQNNIIKVDKQTSPLINLGTQMTPFGEKQKTRDVVFVSKSQEQAKNETSPEDIDPLYICETILNSQKSFDEEINFYLNLNGMEGEPELHSNEIVADDMLSIPSDAMATYNAVEETSHHFHENNKGVVPSLPEAFEDNPSPIPSKEIPESADKTGDFERFRKNGQDFLLNKGTGMTFRKSFTKDMDNSEFSVRNRPRYMPKGMSPIFENCNTKNACNYDLDEDYFGDSMYDEFAKAVDANAEVFEANIESMNDLATTEINKVNERLKKENASLCFQGEHLRKAKILGQVDSKFIAAKVEGKSAQAKVMKEYLVLFDQHAVHERIRLEKNLSEYLTNKKWKSVALDNVTIKLKPDETLYLHNYKDKFEQLGLQWTVEGKDEVSVTAIPEAIIGKNVRQVEIIMKAVKRLILEEIEAIKFQKGSISLYPKSIMDLVFSEACRYAIKFGDRLAYSDCVRLLCELSECKTPFQCAHGRPVMAVLVEIKPKCSVYKINVAKLEKFKKKS